ncbi:unnamed protein product [Moneuplotes crassus]|uniref:Uncharacterized protein n=1 Tax=Euplotes crassus TaxID=5936 RepID=A0AAD1YAM7_EUPCR|nr:unnamed protein product [Moneuplotes crassus]
MDVNKSAFSQENESIKLDYSFQNPSISGSRDDRKLGKLGNAGSSFKTRVVSILPKQKSTSSNDSKTLKCRNKNFDRYRFKSPELIGRTIIPRQILLKRSEAKSRISSFSSDKFDKRNSKNIHRASRPSFMTNTMKRKMYKKRNFSLYEQKPRNFSILKRRVGSIAPSKIERPSKELRFSSILAKTSRNIQSPAVNPIEEVNEEIHEDPVPSMHTQKVQQINAKDHNSRFSRLISPSPRIIGRSTLNNFEKYKFDFQSRRGTTDQFIQQRRTIKREPTFVLSLDDRKVVEHTIEEEKGSSLSRKSRISKSRSRKSKFSNSRNWKNSQRRAETIVNRSNAMSVSPRNKQSSKIVQITTQPTIENFFSLDDHAKKTKDWNLSKQPKESKNPTKVTFSSQNLIYPTPFSSLSKKEKRKYRDRSFKSHKKGFDKRLKKMEIKHKNIRKSLRRSMNKNKGKFKKQSVITGEKWMLKFIEIPKFNTMQRNTLMEKTSEEIRQIIRQRKKESVLML